jgi:hypothetical protein
MPANIQSRTSPRPAPSQTIGNQQEQQVEDAIDNLGQRTRPARGVAVRLDVGVAAPVNADVRVPARFPMGESLPDNGGQQHISDRDRHPCTQVRNGFLEPSRVLNRVQDGGEHLGDPRAARLIPGRPILHEGVQLRAEHHLQA